MLLQASGTFLNDLVVFGCDWKGQILVEMEKKKKNEETLGNDKDENNLEKCIYTHPHLALHFIFIFHSISQILIIPLTFGIICNICWGKMKDPCEQVSDFHPKLLSCLLSRVTRQKRQRTGKTLAKIF